MRGFRALALALAVGASAPHVLIAQAPAAADQNSPDKIKQDLEKIKKGRTLALIPAQGSDDSGGETVIRFDNTSPFDLIVLLVGPTTERVELGPDRMHSLTIEPGKYEIAVTVVGRNLPPFYGRQTVEPKLRFLHKFVIPAVQ